MGAVPYSVPHIGEQFLPGGKAADLGGQLEQLRGKAPWLFLLHTCNTGRAPANVDNVEDFRSAAQQIARADVPFVIAMQYEIENADARTFVDEFYSMLGTGQSIDDAVNSGRSKLGIQSPFWGHRRFATPVVYLRSDAQVLVHKPPPRPLPSSPKQTCPYPLCSYDIDFNLKQCTCDKRQRLKYCALNHANEVSATECRMRDCTAPFGDPRPASAPVAAPDGLGVA